MSDHDLRQISLGLYQYLCRHVVGTEDTVRTKRIWNTLTDNFNSDQIKTIITSGSFGEGLEMKGSDVDSMCVLKQIGVFENIQDIQSVHDKSAYFQIKTDDTKSGFVKLLLIRSENQTCIDLCERVGSYLYLSNMIFKMFFSNMLAQIGSLANDKIHGPCISDKAGMLDLAYCLHCSTWVSQTNQWRVRSHYEWPSDYIKTRIIEHGVLFVPIGVKGSPNEDIQWRISFSVAEKWLTYSFTHTQLLCYALMKIVLKDLINTDPKCEDLLCSYFIKNILFWISEELPLAMWRPDNLVPCFMFCFERLIYCVEYSICIHYFIPENNMFENRIEGEKRHILLDKLQTLYHFKWKCILLSPQFQNFQADYLNFEAHMFDVYFEQIVNSYVIFLTNMKDTSLTYHIRMTQAHRTPLILHAIARKLSELCNGKAQHVHLCSKNRNKELYRQYKTCQCYLMQGLHHDAVSGLLMVASMFYKMKQYTRTLDILFFALDKCSPEKFFYGIKLSSAQRDLLNSKTVTSMGLAKTLRTLCLNQIVFYPSSKLIPQELETEITCTLVYVVPAVIYGHFLSFLCYYHLNDISQCKDSIRNIIQTISPKYFISTDSDEAVAYECLGVAFRLIGDIQSARLAFLHAIQLDTVFNSAASRLVRLDE